MFASSICASAFRTNRPSGCLYFVRVGLPISVLCSSLAVFPLASKLAAAALCFLAVSAQVQRCSFQSPFAAVSCLDDQAVSVSSEVLRDAVCLSLPYQQEIMCAMAPLETEHIPAYDPAADKTVFVEVYRQNSYLTDLYLHGKLSRIVKENGVPPDNLWKLLHRFVSCLHHFKEGIKPLRLEQQEAAAKAAGAVASQSFDAVLQTVHKRLADVLKEHAA